MPWRGRNFVETVEAVEFKCPACKEREIVKTPLGAIRFVAYCSCGNDVVIRKTGGIWVIGDEKENK